MVYVPLFMAGHKVAPKFCLCGLAERIHNLQMSEHLDRIYIEKKCRIGRITLIKVT